MGKGGGGYSRRKTTDFTASLTLYRIMLYQRVRDFC